MEGFSHPFYRDSRGYGITIGDWFRLTPESANYWPRRSIFRLHLAAAPTSTGPRFRGTCRTGDNRENSLDKIPLLCQTRHNLLDVLSKAHCRLVRKETRYVWCTPTRDRARWDSLTPMRTRRGLSEILSLSPRNNTVSSIAH